MKFQPILALLLSLTLIVLAVYKPAVAAENLGYADGYRGGKKAASEDIYRLKQTLVEAGEVFVKRFSACELGRPLTLPSSRLAEISDKPDSYQQGYVHGYEERIKEAWNEICLENTWASTATLTFLAIVMIALIYRFAQL